MLIRDVVSQNPQAAFVNDVQLAWYPNSEYNLPLVRGYMFTGTALEGKVASAKVLETLRDAFVYGSDNRHVVIATYGHGKSHFALALANFFGQSVDSPEVNALLRNIEHTTDASKAANLRDFKADRPPFLIIRLRGDQPQNLHQQFIQALENAIAEHPATKGTALPFWFDKAETFLKGLSGDNLTKANQFLAPFPYDTDVATLLGRISYPNRDQNAYELCVMVFAHITGVKPDFGGEVSLERVVEWATKTFCADTEPLAGGILILFDEFSAFIHRYAHRPIQADTPLQDLLNGVTNCQRKVVFVAFSQRDPIADARDVYQHGGEKFDSLEKELTRLPQAQWHSLYSSLETVLNAYLKQTDAINEIAEIASVAFTPAITDTMQMLKPRYDDQMGWGYERLDQIVARGCFPLHPLTTGLFCSVELRQSTDPRSVLGFVLHELKLRLDQPALIEGRPNWIYPVALVDWFGEMLADREYKEYQAAAAMVGPDAPVTYHNLLKAILIFAVGRIQLGRMGLNFSKAAAHLTGYSITQCEQALDVMRAAGYVRYDELRKVYTFWPPNAGVSKIETRLKKELEGKTLEAEHIKAINQKDVWVVPIAVSGVDWGCESEWSAREILLTRKYFTAANIGKLAPRFRVDPKNGIVDGVRGCVFRLIATTDEDVIFFHDKADQIIKEALGDHPLPVVFALPEDPLPKLGENLLASLLLKEWPSDVRTEVTLEAYQDKVKRVENDIKSDLEKLRGFVDLVVPHPYRARVQEENANHKIETALRVCYKQAYTYSPKIYFTHHSSAAINYKNAVYLVCEHLITDSLSGAAPAISANKVAGDLIGKYLRQTATNGWGILTASDQIVSPTNLRVKPAWDLFEKRFAVGCEAVPVKNVLTELLNPPYGYDYHHVELLFCAWYGFNRRFVKLTAASGNRSIHDYVVHPTQKSARDFMSRICYSDPPFLARTDPGAKEREVRDFLAKIHNETFTLTQASNLLQSLRGYQQDDSLDAGLRKQVENEIALLTGDLQKAKTYQAQHDSITYEISTETSLSRLLPIAGKIAGLPILGRVDEDWPSKAALKSKLDSAVASALDKHCQKLENLKNVADYALNYKTLEELRGDLKGNLNFIDRVETALSRLKATKLELDNRRRDQEITSEVKAMLSTAPLTILLANQAKLAGYAPHSDETKTLIQLKQQELAKAIEVTENFATSLPTRIDGIVSPQAAQNLLSEVQREYNLYRETPYQQDLDQIIARCSAIHQCLTQLQFLRASSFRSPAEMQELSDKLAALMESSQAVLSTEQINLFALTRSDWQLQVQAKKDEARQWLTKHSGWLDQNINLDQLQQTFSAPPPFLPDDCLTDLTTLKAKVALKLDAEAATRKLVEQDQPIETAVKAMKVTEGLAALRQNLMLLKGYHPALPETTALIQDRHTKLEAAIHTLQQQIADLPQKIDAAVQTATVRQIDQSIQRIRNQYADTDELAALDEMSARCKVLETCWQKLTAIGQKSFNRPEDLTALYGELSELRKTYAAQLSDTQIMLFADAERALQQRLAQQQQKAIQWLDGQQSQLETTGNLDALLAALATPSAFLPDSEHVRLQTLRNRVQAKIDERREAAAQKARDAEIAAAVKAIPTSGGLASLRQNIALLQSYHPLLAETQALHHKKVETIRGLIAGLESELPRFASRLDEAASAKQVQAIREDLIRAQDRYADTAEQNLIAEYKQRCETLTDCLKERARMEQAHPGTPNELSDLLTQLAGLYEKNSAILSPTQLILFEQAATTLTTYGQAKAHEASLWLQQCERQAETMQDANNLMNMLASPPPYLPTTCAPIIEDLRHRVQQQLDQDQVGTVLLHFKQIKDKTKRVECLLALQTAMLEATD